MCGGPVRTCIRGVRLGLAAVAAGLCLASTAMAGAPAPPEHPQRIVSINLCTDELALRLARPGAVASVSYLSRRPDTSNVVAEASATPVNYGLVEDVISFRPDLALAGLHTNRNSVTLLRALGVPVVEMDTPPDIDGVRQQIRDVGALLGGAERAEALVRAFDARLPKVDLHAPRPRAVVVRAGGFTAGPGALLDNILTRAGVDNLAAAGPLAGQAQPPLEAVIRSRPDMLILTDEEGEGPALAGEALVHPALKALAKHARVVTLPARLWTCSGPGVAEAVARLALAADDWRAAHKAGGDASKASPRP
ncbi:ABC transporter substrate-binding protein [Camelimonas sp. ID_303_24]